MRMHNCSESARCSTDTLWGWNDWMYMQKTQRRTLLTREVTRRARTQSTGLLAVSHSSHTAGLGPFCAVGGCSVARLSTGATPETLAKRVGACTRVRALRREAPDPPLPVFGRRWITLYMHPLAASTLQGQAPTHPYLVDLPATVSTSHP